MRYSLILYPIFIILCFIFKGTPNFLYARNLSMLQGIVIVLIMSAHYIETGKWHVNSFLSESSFFIYAYHGMVVALLAKIGLLLMPEITSGWMLADYFLSAFLTVAIGLMIYYYIKKYMPKFTNFITGGR